MTDRPDHMGSPQDTLRDVKVLEVGHLLPSAATGANLAALGAEVTRIEPPGGDLARFLYGGWLHELYGAGKQSVTLDLTTTTGAAALTDLVEWSDMMVVGYRPDAARRLGLDAESVRSTNPDLAHCSIVGYRSDGPDADRPGHDLSFLARSGALAEPAGPSAEGLPPRRPAVPIADLAAAATATQRLLAAHIEQLRGRTPIPIEVSIADATLGWMAPRLGAAVDDRFQPALDPANDIYRCSDGRYVAIASIEPKFWTRLCSVVEPTDASAPAMTSSERIERRTDLGRDLAARFATRSADEWISALGAVDVPCDAVLDGRGVARAVGGDLATWRRIASPIVHADEVARS